MPAEELELEAIDTAYAAHVGQMFRVLLNEMITRIDAEEAGDRFRRGLKIGREAWLTARALCEEEDDD